MSNNRAIIPLQQDFEPENLLFVKLVQTYDDGTTAIVEVPKADGRSIEALLYCLNEFKEAAKELAYDTGAEYFSNYRKTLDGTTRTSWDNVVAAQEEDQTPETWKSAVASFLKHFMPKDARQIQIDYLEGLSKPKDMGVRLFGERLQTLVRYLVDLPSEDATLTVAASRVKNILFRAMPRSWQTQFIRSKEGISSVSFQDLVQFMSNEKEFTDGSSNRGGQSKSQRNSRGDYQGNNNNCRNRGRNHGKKRKGEDSNQWNGGNKKQRTLKPNDQCPLPRHGGHTWNKCFDNPNGENYRPFNPQTGRREFTTEDRTGRRQGNNHNNSKYNRRGGGYTGPTHGGSSHNASEQFAVETSESAPANDSVKPLPSQQGHAMPTASGGMQPATKTVGWRQPEGEWYSFEMEQDSHSASSNVMSEHEHRPGTQAVTGVGEGSSWSLRQQQVPTPDEHGETQPSIGSTKEGLRHSTEESNTTMATVADMQATPTRIGATNNSLSSTQVTDNETEIDLVPSSVMVVGSIQDQPSGDLLRVLFDGVATRLSNKAAFHQERRQPLFRSVPERQPMEHFERTEKFI